MYAKSYPFSHKFIFFVKIVVGGFYAFNLSRFLRWKFSSLKRKQGKKLTCSNVENFRAISSFFLSFSSKRLAYSSVCFCCSANNFCCSAICFACSVAFRLQVLSSFRNTDNWLLYLCKSGSKKEEKWTWIKLYVWYTQQQKKLPLHALLNLPNALPKNHITLWRWRWTFSQRWRIVCHQVTRTIASCKK